MKENKMPCATMKITTENLEAMGFYGIISTPSPDLRHYVLPIGHLVCFGGEMRKDKDLMIEVGQSHYVEGDWLVFLRSASFMVQLRDATQLAEIERLYRAITDKEDMAKKMRAIHAMCSDN